jgi:uncharacterized protein DUF4129
LFLLVVFVTTVIAWKALRRRRRRRHGSAGGRVAGAWAETVDRCTERGAARPLGTTPQEAVGLYLTTTELGGLDAVGPELRRLANEVDRAAYAAGPPDPEHVEQAWACSDRVTNELRRNRNAAQRVRMRLDPRPLLRDEAKAGSRS